MAKCCFALLILSIVAYLTTSFNFELEKASRLVEFVCPLAKDFLDFEKNVKTIAIVKFHSDLPENFFNDIGQCMPKNVSVVVMDFNKKEIPLTPMKVSLVILVTDNVRRVDAANWVLAPNAKHAVIDHLSKIIIVTSKNDRDMIDKILRSFTEFGALDTTAVYVNDNVSMAIEWFNVFTQSSNVKRFKRATTPAQKTFPKRLADLNGHKFKVGVYEEAEIRVNDDGEFKAFFLYFLDALKSVMNASYEVHDYPKYSVELSTAISKRQLDVHLLRSRPGKENGQILSYESVFACVYPPRPEKLSLLQMMLIEPFEWRIWLTFIMTVLSTAFIWRLYRDHGADDSAFYFVFGILVFFIGQSVTFHTGKRILVIILQIYMFVTMILSCLYQGEMTSFMTAPLVEHRLKTVEEFSKVNFKVAINPIYFREIIALSYPEIYKKFFTADEDAQKWNYARMRQENVAHIIGCGEFSKKYFYLIFEDFADSYYQIPEVIHPYYRFYDLSYCNPFEAKWQEQMDWSFSTGLHQHWNFLLSQEFSYTHEIQSIEEEKFYLELGDMAQMFYILFVGLLAGFLAFLGEVLYTYCCGMMIMRHFGNRRWIYGVN